MSVSDDQKAQFWNGVIRALEAEPREVRSLRGKSGLSHPVVAVGIDEQRRRAVVISGEPDARAAAMAAADIQASLPDTRVVMARPAAVNLAPLAKAISDLVGRTELNVYSDLAFLGGDQSPSAQEALSERMREFGERSILPLLKPFEFAPLNLVATWQEVIHQLALLRFETRPAETSRVSVDQKAPEKRPFIHMNELVALDPVELDRLMGVCSIPLYELGERDVEILLSASDIDAIRDVLRTHDVFQYFFPPSDHLALGLIESSPKSVATIIDEIAQVPQIGHPFGELELVRPDVKLVDVVAALQEQGLVVEGEVGFELSPSGGNARATVKFRPREGFMSKLSRIVSLKVDVSLGDLFK